VAAAVGTGVAVGVRVGVGGGGVGVVVEVGRDVGEAVGEGKGVGRSVEEKGRASPPPPAIKAMPTPMSRAKPMMTEHSRKVLFGPLA
jgi:hypothetical protein